MASTNSLLSRISLNLLVLAIVLLTAIPYVYMAGATFKPNTEVYSLPIKLLPSSLYMGNYEQLFDMFPYVRWFLNTVFVAGLRTVIAIVLCAMGGYAFAKYEFKFKRTLFILLLATMMLPFHVVLIPLFIMMVRFRWVNTYYALIIPFAVSAYGIFLLRQYMVSVPSELIDAARIDGSSEMGTSSGR
jgi:ABC-type glycerol-3-phosphate transport system permease component